MTPASETPEWSWLNSIAIAALSGMITLLIGGLLAYANSKRIAAATIAEAHEKLRTRVGELENQMAAVHSTVVPISAAFQAMLIKDLTHFHTPEMDELMVKIGPPFTLTEVEVARLAVLLEERSRDMNNLITETERDAASMLPLVMKRVLADKISSGVESEPLVRIMVASTKGLYSPRSAEGG